MEAGDFEDFGGAEGVFVDDPAAEEAGGVFGDVVLGEEFGVEGEGELVGVGGDFLLEGVDDGEAVEEIGGGGGFSAEEDARGDALVVTQIVARVG